MQLGACTLRHVDFDEMARRTWSSYNCTEQAVSSGLCASERELFDRFVKKGDRILLIGSGSGRDLFPFLHAGHEVVAVEPAQRPVALLRDLLKRHRVDGSVHIIEGFIENVQTPGTFDAIIFSRLCYGYVRQSARRIELLRALRRQVKRGGRIMISYVQTDATRRARAIELGRVVCWLVGSDWRPEPNDVLQCERSDGDARIHCEHWFTFDEIEAEAREAGLSILAHWSPEGAPTIVLAP